MADFKRVLFALILLAFTMKAFGAKESSLGYGRTFGWTFGDDHLNFLGEVKHVEAHNCCQECKAHDSHTEGFSYHRVATDKEILNRDCSCYERKQRANGTLPKGPWPETVKTGYRSGLCGHPPITLVGAVGEGRWYNTEHSVRKMGEIYAEDHGQCCEKCSKKHPSTHMYRYELRRKSCYCEEAMPGLNLVTEAVKDYAGICGCNDAGHGIPCCSAGFMPGDNEASKGEMFIQANQYLTTCLDTCKSLYSDSTGVTESVKQKYSSGNGRNKNKCWCEFGKPQLDYGNADYQTCVFGA